jgi:hypothetical protein
MIHYALSQAGLALKLIGWAAAFYVGSPLLIGIAVVPTTLRAYQLYSRNFSIAIEVVVELVRVGLFLAIVAVGRQIPLGSLMSGKTWEAMARDVAPSPKTDWGAVLLRLAAVLLVVMLFNRTTERALSPSAVATVLDRTGMETAKAPETRDAILFVVKNFVVIPLWVICIFRVLGVIGGEGER